MLYEAVCPLIWIHLGPTWSSWSLRGRQEAFVHILVLHTCRARKYVAFLPFNVECEFISPTTAPVARHLPSRPFIRWR